MALGNKPNTLWQDKSLAFKASLGLGLLVGFMAVVAITGYLSLRYVRMADNAIAISTEIQRMVLEMDGGMAKARHLHAKFFLYYPRIGLRAAHEQYAQPSIRRTAEVVSISKALKEMISRPEVSETIFKSRIDVNLYLSSAKRFADTSIESVELVTRLAAPEKGLYARLNLLLSELKTEVVEFLDLYHEMESFVQQYRVTNERFLMQSAFNVEFKLKQMVKDSPLLSQQHKDDILSIMDRIKPLAKEIMDVDVAIHAKFNDFVLQERNSSIISEKLVALAKSEVQKSQERITNTHWLANLILMIITFAGLIVAVVISHLITVKITHRILQLTKSAESVRKGHFELVEPEGVNDEIGQLSRTFNFMALRIKELVENLENKVAQRNKALAISEKRFHEFFEHSSSGVAIYEAVDGGKDFELKEINPAMEKIQGFQRHKVLGQRVTRLFPSIVEDGLFKIFQEVWHTGKTADHPVGCYCNAQVQSWHENQIYKLPGGDLVTVCNDKTLEKQAEIQKEIMDEQLRQGRKMEAIGRMAGGVAHDLNNVLAPVVGYPELLLPELSEDSTLREALMAILNSGRRATKIVADLLTMARGVADTRKELDLNDLVKSQLDAPEIRKLLVLHEEIECQVHLESQLLNISCSSTHIQKCVMNLLINAIDAVDGKGRICISTSNCTVAETDLLPNPIPNGEYVVFRISDSGDEISPADLERIFEPFYIKKITDKSGTGLGLAVTWNIVKEHGGRVGVESGANGTTFSLYFPAMEKKEVSPDENPTGDKEQLMGHGEHILVIDDDIQVSSLAKNILERFGYHAEYVNSGEAALDYLKENSVDLVLLDMLMEPGINGRQTYEAMIKIHPGQRAVVASGFSESEEIEKTLALGAGGFIKKPYAINELARIVKACLP
ncbi:response regulator [Desulfocicer niacini]